MIGCVALFFVERFIDRLVACVALLMMSVRQQVNSVLEIWRPIFYLAGINIFSLRHTFSHKSRPQRDLPILIEHSITHP